MRPGHGRAFGLDGNIRAETAHACRRLAPRNAWHRPGPAAVADRATMKPIRIFAYGTLRDPGIFRRVVGTDAPVLAALPALLPGFRRAPLAGTPYDTLVRDRAAEVEGLLIEVDRAALVRLHRYEERLYRFRPVHVRVGSLRVPAHAWIAPT